MPLSLLNRRDLPSRHIKTSAMWVRRDDVKCKARLDASNCNKANNRQIERYCMPMIGDIMHAMISLIT